MAYPEEFELFYEGIKAFRKTLIDEEYGTVDGLDMKDAVMSRGLQRALFQTPETLHNMIVMGLLPDEMVWFKSIEGGHWFAKKFPAFRLPQKI